MTKNEYLSELRRCLAQMPAEELEQQIAYYDELLSDMIEDGMSEQDATEQLGTPAAVAQELLESLPLHTLVSTRVKPEGGWTVLSILLIVLGAPLWLPLLIAFGAVVLAVVITLWALEFSLAAVVLSLGVAAIALPFGLFTGTITASIPITAGAMMVLLGLSILGILLIIPVGRGIAKLCAGLFRALKSFFIKRRTTL